MKDYHTQNIEYPDYPSYLINLQKLSSYDFEGYSYDQIYHKFHDLALTIPLYGAKLLHKEFNGYKFFRVRLEKSISDDENMNNPQTFSFPPPNVCKWPGRANIENRSVFYCTNKAFPAIREVDGKVGDIGFMSLWEVKAGRDLQYVSCLSEILPNKNEWEEYGIFHHNFLIDRQTNENPEFLPHKIALKKMITDKFMMEKDPYSICSMIANEYMYENKKDMILYSSVRTFHDYINFAIKPLVVLDNLICEKVVKFQISNIEREKLSVDLRLTGDVSGQRIYWRKINDKDGLDLGLEKNRK